MEKMCPKKAKVKREMLKKLKGKMGNNPDMLEGMKVSVMAEDKKGLKEGLEKAKELLEGKKLKELFEKKYKKMG